MRSPLSSATVLAAATAMLLLLAIAPESRSALGSPLRVSEKDRLQEREPEQEQDLYDGDEDGDAEGEEDLVLLDGADYAPEDDDDNNNLERSSPTHSGDGGSPLVNSSQEASSAEVALYVEFLASLLRELRTPNSSLSLSEALSLSTARVADQRLCTDHFFRHFFGITSCGGGGVGHGNDVAHGFEPLETDVDASAPADGEKGVALRSAAVNILDALLGGDIDEDSSLFEEP